MNIQTYIKKVGIQKLSDELGLGYTTIFSWYSLSKAPRPIAAAKLIEHSAGALSWSAIYQPFVDAKTKGDNANVKSSEF